MMGMSTSQRENIDARIMGGELGAAVQLTDHWKADATLAYAWGKNSSDGNALPQMPPLDARFGLTYSEDNWSAGALWRVVAAQNRIDQNKGNVVGKDYDKTRRLWRVLAQRCLPDQPATGRSAPASTTCSARLTPST